MEVTLSIFEIALFVTVGLIVLGMGIRIAYREGRWDALDDRYERDMKQYWKGQEMRKDLGLSYQVKGTYEVIDPE